MTAMHRPMPESNIDYWRERTELAAAFRWAERLNYHEAVANHFSLAVDDEGSQFLINPKLVHFRRIRASQLLLLNVHDQDALARPDAPDTTAWYLHSALHRLLPRARCALHVHSIYATVLATLDDSVLPPIEQNSTLFYKRIAIDTQYGGLALDDEAARACKALRDPQTNVLVMGNHGVMVIGSSVADAFTRLYTFERACEIYIKALWTQKPLRVLSDAIASKTRDEFETYPGYAEAHLRELIAILDEEGSTYAT